MPKKWVQKMGIHIKEITKNLGGYLKTELILIMVSFVISVIGLNVLKFVGMNVKYPLLIALAIGFVDALPILGSKIAYGSLGNNISIKWGFKTGNFNFGIMGNNVDCKTIFRT
ncbi:MAG: AI-2E family transporter [Clostridia bacterium]